MNVRMQPGTVDACVTVNVACDAVTVNVPVRSQPAPLMLAVPTPGLNANPAGTFRIVVVPSASSPMVVSAIAGPVSVVNVVVPNSSAEMAEPPDAGLMTAADAVANGTSEASSANSSARAVNRPRLNVESTSSRLPSMRSCG